MELVFSYIGSDGACLKTSEVEKAEYKIFELDEDVFSWSHKVNGKWYPGRERAPLSRIEAIIDSLVRKSAVESLQKDKSAELVVIEDTLYYDANIRELEKGKARNALHKAEVLSDGTANLYTRKNGDWKFILKGTLPGVREHLDKMVHKGINPAVPDATKTTEAKEEPLLTTPPPPAEDKSKIVYFDKTGALLSKVDDKASRYKVSTEDGESGTLCKRKGSTWFKIAEGTLRELMDILDKLIKEEVKPRKKPVATVAEEESVKVEKQVPAKPEVIITQPADAADAPNATKVLYHRIKSHTSYTLKELNDYLYICMCRNRKLNTTPIINTRLTDYMGQELYVIDTGWGTEVISQENLRIVDSLKECKGLLGTCADAALPSPIQWCTDPADYIWDSTVKVLPISMETFDHITKDRVERLPVEFRGLAPTTLIDSIRRSIAEGEAMSCRDATYALPSYSRKYDKVNMLLPLRFISDRSQVPEAVMLITKSTMGYRLCTIITPEQAYVGVRAIRDPNLTWLKGVRA